MKVNNHDHRSEVPQAALTGCTTDFDLFRLLDIAELGLLLLDTKRKVRFFLVIAGPRH